MRITGIAPGVGLLMLLLGLCDGTTLNTPYKSQESTDEVVNNMKKYQPAQDMLSGFMEKYRV